jgi:hypothetical protein
MKRKIGLFFIYLGLILLVVFFVSDQALHPSYGYFFGGFGLSFLGIYLFWRSHAPVDPNTERFRTMRKWRERQATHKEERSQRKNR